MVNNELDTYSISDLKKIAEKLKLNQKRSKLELINDISSVFNQYLHCKKNLKYKRHNQIGDKGKEGTTFLVTDVKGNEYAMKTFRKGKSSNKLYNEYLLQKKAAKVGVAPHVYDYNTADKWIVMEKMDYHLYEKITTLTKKQQERLVEIFQKLDEVGVFHNDANICNYMVKNGQIYLIDYGFSKEITPTLKKKLQTNTPNYKLMLIGLVLKLKELKVPEKAYKYLLRHICDNDKKKFNLMSKYNEKQLAT